MCYSGTDVLLIGFSIGEPDSLANVEDLWLGESKLESLRDAKVNAFHTFYPRLRFFRNCWWDWRRIWKMTKRPRRLWPRGTWWVNEIMKKALLCPRLLWLRQQQERWWKRLELENTLRRRQRRTRGSRSCLKRQQGLPGAALLQILSLDQDVLTIVPCSKFGSSVVSFCFVFSGCCMKRKKGMFLTLHCFPSFLFYLVPFQCVINMLVNRYQMADILISLASIKLQNG